MYDVGCTTYDCKIRAPAERAMAAENAELIEKAIYLLFVMLN